ncbi:MAG TPA: peptide ABC transporter substrate-binding protein [Candidatus Limnocylindria bacterium]|nr:peptide ABC transporter substrate-binding protein [Candidatus Limnocylindria bacterium]
MTRRWRIALAVGLVAGLVAGACAPTTTPGSTTAPGTQAPGTQATTRGQGGELRLVWWQGPTILNPHLSQGTKDYDAARLVLEPLAAIGPDGKPVARLAAEVPTQANGGFSSDGKTVTWKLRTGVKWSDGSDFTADDVVFTHKYMSDPATAATTSGNTKNVDKVEKVDASTVRVTFKAATFNPYQIFTGPQGMIIQEKQFKDFTGAKAKDAPGNQNPIGTGPYKVSQFKSNDVVVYEINTTYREATKPFFKTVTFKTTSAADASARAVLQTGDADYAWNMQVPAATLKQMAEGGRGEIVTSPSSNVERLLLNRADPRAPGDARSEPNTKHPFLSDLNVRKALAMASNRKAVVDSVYAGLTGGVTCNIVEGVPSMTSKNTANMDVCKFDLAAANKLLDDAGWVKGADGIRAKGGVKMEIVYATTINAVRQATQAIIKSDWEKLGIKVELKSVDAGIFFSSDVANPDTAAKFFFDVEMFTNNSSEPDYQVYLANWITDEIPTRAKQWRGGNYERYSNPAYDALFKELAGAIDPAKRAELTIKMNDLLVQDVVVIPLVARTQPTAAKAKDLKGILPNPWDSDVWNIADWTK